MWASTHRQMLVIVGDLNLNRLRPESREGKILKDFEEAMYSAIYFEPMRITPKSKTLLDVILTNKPDLFKNIA